MSGCQWLWYQLVLVLLVQGALASLQNFTIDDTDGGSIKYSGNWRVDCPEVLEYLYTDSACPNTSQLHMKTVHWSFPSDPDSSPSSFTVQFSGIAVYVYNVLASIPATGTYSPPKYSLANIAFTLDGILVESYQQPQGSGDPQYLYNQLVYMNDTLSNGTHELVVIGGQSLVFFDYIKYTSELGQPPSMPSPSSSILSPLPSWLPGSSTTSTSAIMSVSSSTSTSMVTYTVANPPHTTVSVVPSSDSVSMPSTAMGTSTLTAAATTTATATASSQPGSNLSARAIAGGIVGSVLALLLLGVITLHARRRLYTRRVGKGMGRLLDETQPPPMHNADHFASNHRQFLHPMNPALRPSPNLPRSPPGYVHTMSSMPTTPEPPSRTYMNDGMVTRILETADRAGTEWPSSTAYTRAFPAASRMISLPPEYSE